PRTLAAFTYLNMPKGNPDLTVEQAIDVAAYVASQPRPRFAASSPDAAGPSAAASDPKNNPLAAPLP
ncbi:MAG: hypothetical protein KDA22_03575, partial [Phycisphaerales bacterium]|nr:hypothetical protein [Phycisphaerales bacterium]